MIEWLFETADWPARRTCGIWPNWLVWLTVCSEMMIAWAYLGVAAVLGHLAFSGNVSIQRVTLKQRPLILSFVLVFGTCGVGHLLGGVIVFWLPVYRLIAMWSFTTAVVASVAMPLLVKTVVVGVLEIGAMRIVMSRLVDSPHEEIAEMAKGFDDEWTKKQ